MKDKLEQRDTRPRAKLRNSYMQRVIRAYIREMTLGIKT